MSAPPLRLGVNVDHVATLRNARGGARPDPVRAALAAIEAGADGITAHLREDRRHIRDSDMARLKAEISKPLNFEMAATEDMLRISLATKPHAVCLVPERREELTTEGGLDVVGQHNALAPFIARLGDAGIRVSLFISADPQQIEMAARLRAPVIEIHTGGWCDAVVDGHTAKAEAEWRRIVEGAALARSASVKMRSRKRSPWRSITLATLVMSIRSEPIPMIMTGSGLAGDRDPSRPASAAPSRRGLRTAPPPS